VLPSRDNIYDSGQDYSTEKAWEPLIGVAALSRFYSLQTMFQRIKNKPAKK